MSRSPYAIDGPALIQFSGGRSSGFMLRKILDAHGGSLPHDEIRVVFCNTGLEHPATYAFIQRIEEEWRVAIHWLEYRHDGGHRFAEVWPVTYSRAGEPFEALIRASSYLPNPVTRKCTVELKIRTAKRYAQSLGWSEWTSVIGLRADEPRRVSRMRGDIKAEAEAVAMPMAEAGHTLEDVRALWRSSPFDLELPNDDPAFGNCVGCFLKSRTRLERVMRAEPEHFEWWKRMETLRLSQSPSAFTFRSDRPSYEAMLRVAQTQGVMFDENEESLPCFCTE